MARRLAAQASNGWMDSRLNRLRYDCGFTQKVDRFQSKDSVGETPTGATSSFAKATEDRGTVALPPNKWLMIGDSREEGQKSSFPSFGGAHRAPLHGGDGAA